MINEQRLIESAQAGDKQAMAALYQLYVQEVYRYVFARTGDAPLAEDITSEVFIRALETLPAYRQQGVPFVAWLYRIAGGKVIDYYRWSGRRKDHHPLDERLPAQNDSPEQIAIDNEQVHDLMQHLHQLTESHQQVLMLRFVQGKSLEETARALGKNENAVKALQFRAMQALEKRLKEET